ncbi:MAG: GNAT family N-acetyltransferase [Firmicutes bacterium]|nr:GNAT family N-acetyltransferase [Bacillota bacterium]
MIDAAAICALVRELARANGEETRLAPEFVAHYLCSPGCVALVAEACGRVIGLVSYHIHPNLYHSGPTALIEECVVSEDSRGRGVGEELVAAAIEAAKRAGCEEISVSTMFENEGTQRFYRRLGFGDEALLLEMHFDRCQPAESGSVCEERTPSGTRGSGGSCG